MQGILIVMIVVACIGGIVWMRRRRQLVYTTAVGSETVPRETLGLRAFTQGNTYLAEGKFDEAIAAFHQAREIDPKRPYVDDRIAEAQRQQQAANATPLVKATV